MFKVTGAKRKKLSVTKYEIESTSSQEIRLVGKAELIRMIKDGEIENAELALDIEEMKHEISINGGIRSLRRVEEKADNKYDVTYRILSTENLKDGERQKYGLIGYVIKGEDGKQYRIDKNKLYELAVNGCLNNVEARAIYGVKVLVSTKEIKLADLPFVVQDGEESIK